MLGVYTVAMWMASYTGLAFTWLFWAEKETSRNEFLRDRFEFGEVFDAVTADVPAIKCYCMFQNSPGHCVVSLSQLSNSHCHWNPNIWSWTQSSLGLWFFPQPSGRRGL